jgi:hypothetical protein
MRDLMNHLHLLPAFAPAAAVADNTAQVSSVADIKGFSSCVLAFVTGTDADADATMTLLIEDSADNVTFAAVDDAYLNGTEVLGSYTSPTTVRPARSATSATSGTSRDDHAGQQHGQPVPRRHVGARKPVASADGQPAAIMA